MRIFIVIAVFVLAASGCAKQFPDVTGSGKLTIDSITPVSGIGGTAVLIYGKGFSANPSGNHVYFNGARAAADTVASFNVIRVFAPGLGSTGPVSVATSHDSVTGPVFSYRPSPLITNVTYNGLLIVTGNNFDGAASVVSIGGATETGFSYNSSNGQDVLTKRTYTPATGLDNPAPVVVTARGVPSNAFSLLFYPVITGFGYSRTPDGNPVNVFGSLFGSRSAPSTLRVFIYDVNRNKVYLSPDPTVTSWKTGLILANFPNYFPSPTSIPPSTYVEVSVSDHNSFKQFTN